MFRLEVRLPSSTWEAGAVGILFPVAPATHSQTPRDAVLPEGWNARLIEAKDGQRAYWVSGAGSGRLTDPMISSFVLPEPERKTTASASPADAIAAEVFSRFTYTPGEKNPPPTELCDLRSGNCIDINRYFLQKLAEAGIPARYNIGYFFAEGAAVSEGQHCWVTTLEEGNTKDWDIAHFLKFNCGDVAPALNPYPGVRFAMSVGKALSFDLKGIEARMDYLSFPRWVLPDGSTKAVRLNATLAH